MQQVVAAERDVTRIHAIIRPVPIGAGGVAASGTKRRPKSSDHDDSSRSSGAGTSGITAGCTTADSSARWYDASRLRIAPIAWRATTRRVAKLRPLRIRSTS